MGSPVRSFGRLIIYVLFTVALIPAQVLALALKSPFAIRIPLFYHHWCARILGINVVTRGKISHHQPTLFVSNHTSYIDITVLASLIPASFIAKAEVKDWPFFGLLARLQRTVFVARRAPDAVVQRDDIIERLRAGENLVLFPEGTSNDGNRVLPFKSALFSVAQRKFDDAPLVVQPVSIAYTRLDGMPMGRTLKPHFAWYGDMEMVSHMWVLIGLGEPTVEVIFHPPIGIAEFADRKALALHCYGVVAHGVSEANAGRGARALT